MIFFYNLLIIGNFRIYYSKYDLIYIRISMLNIYGIKFFYYFCCVNRKNFFFKF